MWWASRTSSREDHVQLYFSFSFFFIEYVFLGVYCAYFCILIEKKKKQNEKIRKWEEKKKKELIAMNVIANQWTVHAKLVDKCLTFNRKWNDVDIKFEWKLMLKKKIYVWNSMILIFKTNAFISFFSFFLSLFRISHCYVFFYFIEMRLENER